MKFATIIACCISTSYAFSIPFLQRRQGNSALGATVIRRRAYHASAVLDGFLYIDGGEYSYAGDGDDIQYQYSNVLLSVDLSQDWDNATINLRSNTKPNGAPNLVFGGLWVDTLNKRLFSGFAGQHSSFGDAAKQAAGLWAFSPATDGSGSWSDNVPTSSSGLDFKRVNRPYSGAVASGNGVGYVLGGLQVNQSSTDPRFDAFNSTGLMRYNFTDGSLSNLTVTGISNGGMIQKGGMHFVPNFGPQGVLVAFGGTQIGIRAPGADALVEAVTVQVYDPATDSWYDQATTGSVPTARKEFCITGAASSNNTYEIIVYAGWGGNLGSRAIPYDELYVLSLPSFNWFRADYLPANPRHGLTCEHIGGGQIVTIGGVSTVTNGPDDLYKDVFNPVDTFTQGLGVFDLSTMTWTTGYTAGRTAYNLSSTIQRYYDNNARTPAFASSDLATLMSVENFTVPSTENHNSPNTPGGNNGNGSNTEDNSSISGGAIAGIVIGALAGIALIGLAVFFILRRRKANRTPELEGTGPDASAYPHMQEMPSQGNAINEMDSTSRIGAGGVYAPGGGSYSREDVKYAKVGTEQYEMPGEGRRHELA